MQHSQQLCSIRQGSGHTRWQLKSYSRLPGLIQSIILTPLLCVHTLVLLKQSILFRITALSMKIPHAHRGPNPQLKLILLYISHNLVDSISMHTPYYSEIYMQVPAPPPFQKAARSVPLPRRSLSCCAWTGTEFLSTKGKITLFLLQPLTNWLQPCVLYWVSE